MNKYLILHEYKYLELSVARLWLWGGEHGYVPTL